jgi:uncharacterized protein (DUF486 family)
MDAFLIYQAKVAVALLVFVPFSAFVMKQGVSWNYAAASLCILAAVFLIFRG